MKSSRRQLAHVIADMTTSGRLSAAQTRAIAAYLLTTKQADQVTPLVRDVAIDWIARGRLEVQVLCARPLSAAVVRNIRLRAKQLYPNVQHITIATTRDAKLIGGARIVIGAYQLDLSVQDRLARFKSLALQEKT